MSLSRNLSRNVSRNLSYNLGALPFGGGGDAPFDPNSIAGLRQYLYGTSASLSGLIPDVRTGFGTDRPKQPNRVYDFDGSNDRIAFASDPSGLDITGDYTITGWVKVADAATDLTNTALFSRWLSDVGFMLYFAVGSFAGRLRAYRDGSFVNGPSLAPFNGQWVHVAFVANGTGAQFYINGAADASGTFASATHTSAGVTPEIADYANSTGNSIDGMTSDIRVYDDALTAAEITHVYTFGASGTDPGTTNLQGQWKCDDINPTVAYDSSGNAYHGTKTNITASTFHATDNAAPYNWQNNVGFTQRMSFDATNDYVNYGNVLSKTNTDAFFIEATIATSSTSSDLEILSKSLSSGSFRGYNMRINPAGSTGEVGFYLTRSGSNRIQVNTSGASLNDGNAHTIRATYDGSSSASGVTITIDGVSQATTTVVDNLTGATISTAPLSIGSRNNNSFFFDGSIYDININDELRAQGYGNTNADWVDLVGSNNGTVNGSPSLELFPRDESMPTQDVADNPLQFTGEAPNPGQLINSGCGDFDGTNDFVEVSNSSGDFTFGNGTADSPFSVSAWVNPDANDGSVIGVFGTSVAAREWTLFMSAGGNLMLFFNDSSASVTVNASSTATVPLNTWTHIAATYDGTGGATAANGITLYINGVATASTPTNNASYVAMEDTAQDLWIGRRSATELNGQLCDARIYNTALTAAQIQNIATGGRQGTDPGLTNLAGWWPLSERNGATAYDVSGNDNRGTIMNATTTANTGFWGQEQNEIHYSEAKGYDRVGAFDGVDDYVSLSNATRDLCATTNDFSVAIDVVISGSGGSTQSIVKSTASALSRFCLNLESGSIRAGVWNGAWVAKSASISAGAHRIVVAYNSSPRSFDMWIDGVAATGTASPVSSGTLGMRLGSFPTNSLFFNGDMINCRIYNNTLASPGEADTTTPVRDYRFSSSSGTAVIDSSTSSDNGTLNGDTGANFWATEIPAEANGTSIVRSAPSNPAGAYHNASATDIDFTAGVVSSNQTGWETDWEFNDPRTNPLFRRTLQRSSIDYRADRFLAYSTALSGDDLTNIQDFTATTEI